MPDDCASFLDNALGYVESSAGACEDGSASRMERVELFEKLFAGLFEPFLSSPFCMYPLQFSLAVFFDVGE